MQSKFTDTRRKGEAKLNPTKCPSEWNAEFSTKTLLWDLHCGKNLTLSRSFFVYPNLKGRGLTSDIC